MGIHKRYILSGMFIHHAVTRDYGFWKDLMLRLHGEKAEPHIIDSRRWAIGLRTPGGPGFYRRPNCWEFMGCGDDPDAPCPARTNTELNGTYGGINGGRVCWLVRNTFCGGSFQDTPGKKQEACSGCDFLEAVQREEGNGIVSPPG